MCQDHIDNVVDIYVKRKHLMYYTKLFKECKFKRTSNADNINEEESNTCIIIYDYQLNRVTTTSMDQFSKIMCHVRAH